MRREPGQLGRVLLDFAGIPSIISDKTFGKNWSNSIKLDVYQVSYTRYQISKVPKYYDQD